MLSLKVHNLPSKLRLGWFCSGLVWSGSIIEVLQGEELCHMSSNCSIGSWSSESVVEDCRSVVGVCNFAWQLICNCWICWYHFWVLAWGMCGLWEGVTTRDMCKGILGWKIFLLRNWVWCGHVFCVLLSGALLVRRHFQKNFYRYVWYLPRMYRGIGSLALSFIPNNLCPCDGTYWLIIFTCPARTVLVQYYT